VGILAFGWPDFSPTTWGFIGVVIGGVLVMVGDAFTDWRKSRREDEVERRRLNAEVRVAARLLADELDTIAKNMEDLAKLGRTLERDATLNPAHLPSAAWDEYKRVLALVLDDNDVWAQFATIYHNAAGLKARMAIDGPNKPLPVSGPAVLLGDAVTARALSERLMDVAKGTEKKP
jgi:hypothetical protein